jgi:hypothetical protein
VQRVDHIPSFASSPIPQMPPGTLSLSLSFSHSLTIQTPSGSKLPGRVLRDQALPRRPQSRSRSQRRIHSPDERVTPSTRLRMVVSPGASCMSAGGFARRSNSGSPCGTPIDKKKAPTQSSAPYFPPPGSPPASHGGWALEYYLLLRRSTHPPRQMEARSE